MKKSVVLSLCAISFVTLTGIAWADEVHAHRKPEFHDVRGEFRLDDRFNHDHYYPKHGMAVTALPRGAMYVENGGGRYFFHGGVWYRPVGRTFLVVTPPFGIVVPYLPMDYVTLRIGGRPYFYANGTYYIASPGNGYTVVEPPPNVDQAQGVSAPVVTSEISSPVAQGPSEVNSAPITYPRNGQSGTQNAKDIQECNQWANTQPGTVGNANVFQRAFAACMDGRGYTVR